MKRLGFSVSFENNTVYTSKTKETFWLETTPEGHLALPFVTIALEEDIFNLNDVSKEDKIKRVEKVHNVMCHPRMDILIEFFQNSSEDDEETIEAIKTVSTNCEVCKKFKRTPSRPKVGLPMAKEFNECVSIDLKGPMTNKSYILYLVDCFSRLTRGVIIKDKRPSTIVKSKTSCWVLGNSIGPGMPGKFLHDNGREFTNPDMIDLAEKHSLVLYPYLQSLPPILLIAMGYAKGITL